MNKKYDVIVVLLLGLLFSSLWIFTASLAASSPVYLIPVKGQIEPGWLLFLERSLEEAKQADVQAVILEIDTPGGYIDTAQEAKKLLDGFTDIPVYAYVNTNALSAGAYLALATDGFFMAPGSVIGAAEPVLLGGGVVSEKILSFWEAEMRSTAEKQGKDPQLAAAMVRKEISIEGLVKEGELLTLTTGEAEKLAFSNGTVSSVEELLKAVNLTDAEIVFASSTFWENLSGWLINPIVATLLLIFGFFFMVVEIMTAGFGIGGLLSILCFGLYFSAHFLTGISGWQSIVLFLLGIVLLLVEAFMPGFGILGIGGLVAVVVAIVLAAASTTLGLYMLLVSFIVAGILSSLAYKYFQRRGTLKSFVLSYSATKDAGFSTSQDYSYLLGKKGQTMTPLRPSGVVEIEGKKYDTVSAGEFISPGEAVEVIKIEGYRIVVEKINKEN